MLSTWSNILMASQANPAEALIARMSPAPDAARAILITNLVDALVAGGVWNSLDALYVTAAHNEQASRLNWKGSYNNLVAVNAPVFTTDRGWTGDGAASYLRSDFAYPSGAKVGTSQNNVHVGSRVDTNVTSASAFDAGCVGFGTQHYVAASTARSYISTSSVQQYTLPAATAIGHFVATRDASTNTNAYKNGAALTPSAVTSVQFSTVQMLICAGANRTTGAAGNYSTRRVNAAHWGSNLTAGQITTLYNALSTYLTAVGV